MATPLQSGSSQARMSRRVSRRQAGAPSCRKTRVYCCTVASRQMPGDISPRQHDTTADSQLSLYLSNRALVYRPFFFRTRLLGHRRKRRQVHAPAIILPLGS